MGEAAARVEIERLGGRGRVPAKGGRRRSRHSRDERPIGVFEAASPIAGRLENREMPDAETAAFLEELAFR